MGRVQNQILIEKLTCYTGIYADGPTFVTVAGEIATAQIKHIYRCVQIPLFLQV